MRDDGRGAHVQGQAEIAVRPCRPLDAEHLVDVAAEADRGRDAAVPLPVPRGSAHRAAAEHARQLPRDLQAHLHGPGRRFATASSSRSWSAVGSSSVGSGRSRRELLDQRIEFHRRAAAPPRCGEVAEPLAVLAQALVAAQPRLGRHLDHQVAPRHDLAGQHVAAADFVAGEKLGRLALDLAFADDQAALAADSLRRRRCPHVDVGLAAPPRGAWCPRRPPSLARPAESECESLPR